GGSGSGSSSSSSSGSSSSSSSGSGSGNDGDRGNGGEGERPGYLSSAAFEAAGGAVTAADLTRRAGLVRVRDTAVVMYTSGTTASPKGAMLSHEAFTRFATGVRDRFDLTPDDRIWT